MALPRRPYLLGLLPGTSNDWATQDGAEVGWWGNTERERDIEREREGERERFRGDGRLLGEKKARGKEKKRVHYEISCAGNKQL